MSEKLLIRELKLENKKKSYPDWIGTNLRNRKYFDIGISSLAAVQDASDMLSQDKNAAVDNTIKFAFVYTILSEEARQSLPVQEFERILGEQFVAEAISRGTVTKMPQDSVLPFAPSIFDAIDKMDELRTEFSAPEFSAKLMQIGTEINDALKVPMYPDSVAKNALGRYLFDQAVHAFAGSENDSENKDVHERQFKSKTARLAEWYVRGSGSYSEDQNAYKIDSILEAVNRDYVRKESNVVDELLHELFPEQTQKKSKLQLWKRKP